MIEKEIKLANELEIAKALSVNAGKAIMEIYTSNSFDIANKEDNIYINANLKSSDIINNGLKNDFPNYGLLNEKTAGMTDRLNKDYVWIVDPLDGVKEFISGNEEFTINIGLVYRGEPVLGVIYLPAKDILFFATRGNGAFFENKGNMTKLSTSNKFNVDEMIIIKNKYLSEEREDKLIKSNRFKEIKTAESSFNGCSIAKGESDVYFKFGSVYEWNICAMNVILMEAKGELTNLGGFRLKYNKENTLIEDGFLASNGKIHNYLLALEEIDQNG